MQDLLQAAFCRANLYESLPVMSEGEEPGADVDVNLADGDSVTEEQNIYATFLKDADTMLYPGCKFSRLSFLVTLYHLKCLHGWTQESFTSLLGVLSTALPIEANLPKTYYEAKKIIHGLGLGYVKIHACPNDCMLFRVKTSDDMRWHDEGRTKDGKLRHPADGEAWRDFDARYPDFAADARNVRLGLASDGFNPFGNMSIKHSTWPVMLVPYNLPPWICMKESSLLLSMIIPGPESPGNDIDIYLQPLIDELLDLWGGVNTVDASSKKKFRLRAALLWTINDFPALAYLYGWSTSGRYGCPSCGPATKSFYLNKSKKMCYMGHRQWLLDGHIYRRQKRQFDGNVEAGTTPEKMSGTTVLKMLGGRAFVLGKKRCIAKIGKQKKGKNKQEEVESNKKHKRKRGENRNSNASSSKKEKKPEEWLKKRSVFFMLPYWEHNKLRHNLDVMHIEKNVCDNFIGTLLDIQSKSKDGLNARLDLVELGIRHDLHPVVDEEGKQTLPDAPFTMSREKKEIFCSVIQNIRTPDGYASNISRFFVRLKALVKNRAHPEGSIAEGYRLEECMTFCSRFLDGNTRFTRPSRNPEPSDKTKDMILFDSAGEPIGKETNVNQFDNQLLIQAHRYVLRHCDELEDFRKEFVDDQKRNSRASSNLSPSCIDKLINEHFADWLEQKIILGDGLGISKKVIALAAKPRRCGVRYSGYVINGFRFHTMSREAARLTQNSGVVNIADGGINYYGRLSDIIELSYGDYKVVLFKCDWYDVHHRAGLRKDEFGFTLVNFSRKIHTGENLDHDPFVFSSQVEQVFYIEDPKAKGWNFVNEVSMLMLKYDPQYASSIRTFYRYVKDKVTRSSRMDIKSLTQTYTSNTSLVAILITTITFAAALTLPGGYSTDVGNEGHPIMARKFAFQAFLISDTLAMCSSLGVAFICIIARWEDLEFLLHYRYVTKKLMWFAYMATTTAFATGLYTVLAPRLLWLAITICILMSLLPILTKLLGEWPILKLRFRLGQNFESQPLEMMV
ncbi:hypothetical protein U9M48_001243 [Paspalum notatum var. saurae]|uniref:DUF4216 domain-containing protein n=1 Tax=Paspalum notatum var. saurae TaxID=547442 RepID=A0AAQ3SCT9_PASNO